METQTQTQFVTQPNSKYYAIHQPPEHRGVYRAWDEVKRRIDTVPFNRNKSFFTQEEADYWAEHGVVRPISEGQPRRPLLQPGLPKTQLTSVRPVGQVEAPKSPVQPMPQAQWQRPRSLIPEPPVLAAKRDRADAVQPDAKKPNSVTDVAHQDDGVSFADLENVLCVASWYAVARGRRPGLYSDWAGPDGAQEQVDGFKGAVYKKISGRTAAIAYLRSHHVSDHKIRFFARSSRTSPGSTSRAMFNDEWKIYAATQMDWSPHESRKEKIDAIFAEIIRHYLPGGISEDQIDDGNIVLTDNQTLTIYQGMLQAAKKEPGDSIYDCLHRFKAAPYVNILDFVDACRRNEQVKTFAKWEEFKSYSLDPSHKIDVMYAKENELLAPLLHNLSKGPDAGNPISVRKRFEKKRALKNRTVEDRVVTEQGSEVESRAASVVPVPVSAPASVSVPVPEADLGYSAMLARWTPSPPSPTSPVSIRGPTAPASDHLISHAQEGDQTVFDAPEVRLDTDTGSPAAFRTPISNPPAPQPPILDDLVMESGPTLNIPAIEPPPIELRMQNLAPSQIPASTSDYGEVIEMTQEEVVVQPPPAEETLHTSHAEFRISSSAPASPSIPIRGLSMERSDELDLVQNDTIPQTPPSPELQSSVPIRSSVKRRVLMVRIPAKQHCMPPSETPSKLNKREMDPAGIEAERPRKRGRPPKVKSGAD